jgi:excisionase family DNA binding protein
MARRTTPTPLPDPADLITVAQTMERYQVGRRTVYHWAEAGLITLYKVGNLTRIDKTEADAALIRRARQGVA